MVMVISVDYGYGFDQGGEEMILKSNYQPSRFFIGKVYSIT
jgi:hypothetical protein